MNAIMTIMRRELKAYFVTPLAWVYGTIFLLLAGSCTFYLGHFFTRGQADLEFFFFFHPWLYLFLIPGLCMQMWAEERKSGTLELLLTLPITTTQAVVGKFLAAWTLVLLLLLLTFPMWVTVNYLGTPDNTVIFASYAGSFVMAGAYIAIGCCFSTITVSQVVAFILTLTVCLLFVLSGTDSFLAVISGVVPANVMHAIETMSFVDHFNAIVHGVLDMRDVIYFVAMIAFWLLCAIILLDVRRGR